MFSVVIKGNMPGEFARVQIQEFEKKSLKGYTLIEGFPGLGLVGTICAKHLIEKLDFRKYGYLQSNIFVPVIRIREGKPVYPSRIFVNDKLKLVVIISEQVIPAQFIDDFARAIVEFVCKKGIKRVISLSGIQVEDSEQKIYGMGANDNSIKILKKYKIEPIAEGITTGISALMMLELKCENVEAVSLLSTVKIAADYKAAAELIKKLNEILSLKLGVEPLLSEAKKTEEEITAFMQKMKETQDNIGRMEESAPAPIT